MNPGKDNQPFEITLDTRSFTPYYNDQFAKSVVTGEMKVGCQVVSKPKRIFNNLFWQLVWYISFGNIFRGGFEYKIEPIKDSHMVKPAGGDWVKVGSILPDS